MSNSPFLQSFSTWSNAVASEPEVDWTEQLSILSDIEDLITSDQTLEEITFAIYENVNRLMDAYQFAVGIYNEKENTITYRGMIEDGQKFPDLIVNSLAKNRFASWCIEHESEIFINDMDRDYSHYMDNRPIPLTGIDPKSAIYVPLRLNHQIVGVITVRTPNANAYQQHHLYILKTVGSFLVRTMALTNLSSSADVHLAGKAKTWKWTAPEKLSPPSQRALQELTEREKEVLFLFVSGHTNKEIAQMLFVSPGTIKSHTLNIYQKMDVANRTSAIMKALESGWIS